MNNEEKLKFYKPKAIETEPLKREVLVHGAMNYVCQDCGRVFKMWLEKGLEDKIQDAEYPKKHKPVPFAIGCLCGGTAQHIAWHEDVDLSGYRPIGDNMSYFENLEDRGCGIPHLRTDGSTSTRQRLTSYDMKEILARQYDKAEIIEEPKRRTGLEMYSTTQLKAELRRRKHLR